MDLDVKTKATLLGATFLIVSVTKHNPGDASTSKYFQDFMAFERKNNNNNNYY